MEVTATNSGYVQPTQRTADAGQSGAAAEIPPSVTTGIGELRQLLNMPDLPIGTSMSAEDVDLLLASAFSKLNDLQLKTQEQGVNTASAQKKEQIEAIRKKMQEAFDAAQKAKHKTLLQKIFGWIEKIFMVIVAAIVMAIAAMATALTAGAAGALMGLAAMFLVMAIVDLAGKISEEAGGPSFSAAGLLTKGTSELLQKFGMSKEKADEVAGHIVMAVTIVAMVAMLVLSCGTSAPLMVANMMKTAAVKVADVCKIASRARAASEVADTATQTGTQVAKTAKAAADATSVEQATAASAKAAENAAEEAYVSVKHANEMATSMTKYLSMAEGVSMTIAGVSAIGSGAAGAEAATLELKSNKAKVAAMLKQAIIDELQKDIEEHLQNMRDLFQANVDFFSDLSKGMQRKDQSRSTSIARMA